jgi:hypothetical protein
MEIDKIPVLKQSFSNLANAEYVITLDNNPASLDDLKEHAVDAIMPPGWIKYNKA